MCLCGKALFVLNQGMVNIYLPEIVDKYVTGKCAEE